MIHPMMTHNDEPFITSEERRLDAEELIVRILPRCSNRPNVYNEVARVVKEIQIQTDELALQEAKTRRRRYRPVMQIPFVMHVPFNSNADPMDERRLEVALLYDLVAVQRRPYVVKRLNAIRVEIEEEIKCLEAKFKEKATKRARVLDVILETMRSLLPSLYDFPHLYNQVVAHMAMIIEEINETQSRQGFFWVKPFLSMHVPEKLKESDQVSALDRWLEVQRLDEISDILKEGSFAKAAIETMKQSCEMEAKALQKKEADVISHTRKGRAAVNRVASTSVGRMD